MNIGRRLLAHFAGDRDPCDSDDADAALAQACALEGGHPYLASELRGEESPANLAVKEPGPGV